MHNPALAALGLDWRYLACDVHPDRLREAIAGAQAMKFIGLNLTVPHKLLAVDIVDALDVSARTWGAVNTVRFEAKDAFGAWQPLAKLNPDDIGELRSHGFNTDADAITRSLREDLGFEPRGASVLQLGAGGAKVANSWDIIRLHRICPVTFVRKPFVRYFIGCYSKRLQRLFQPFNPPSLTINFLRQFTQCGCRLYA